MARARNIKPGFFTNDKLAECEPLARILFVGLWTIADREGRLFDRYKKIKAEILPYDDCDVDDLLRQLYIKNLIIRYIVNNEIYIQIVNFTKHQQPHYKEVSSIIPPPENWTDSGTTAGSVSENIRLKILSRDGMCVRCQSIDDLTLDHIIPRSAGGSHEESNLQTLCRKCNSSKNNRLYMLGQSQANHEPTKVVHDTPLTSSLIPDSPSPLIESIGSVVIGDFQKVYDFGCKHFPDLAAKNTHEIRKWLEAGCDPGGDILPEIQASIGRDVGTWRYFSKAIMNAKATRETPLPKGTINGKRRTETNTDRALAGLYRAGTELSAKQRDKPAEHGGGYDAAKTELIED